MCIRDRPEPEKGLIGGVLDKLKEIDSSIRSTPAVEESESPSEEPQENVASDWYSQEMLSSGQPTATTPSVVPESLSNRCPACGHLNPSGESYCETCGNLL